MGLLNGKKGIVFGVANQKSLAWSIAKLASSQGAELCISYQNERLESRVKPLADELKASAFMCDATSQDDLDNLKAYVQSSWGALDFVVHAIAFAKSEELQGDYLNTTQDGFRLAMDVSAYTLTAISKTFRALFSQSGGSILTLTYIGAERVVPGYNVMGVAKSALEASVRYLAFDLGKNNVRVNALSAGPVNTLAARGIHGFSSILKHVEENSPLQRNITAEEVASNSLYLLSDLSSGVTGEVLHVDCGYHIKG